MTKSLRVIYEWWLDWKINNKITSALLNVTLLSIAVLIVTYYVINTNEEAEHDGTQWMALSDQILAHRAEKINGEVEQLVTLSRTPLLIETVKNANTNRSGWTPEFIRSQDQAWTDHEAGIESTVRHIVGNAASRYLIDFHKDNPEEVEVFITDSRGLNIAMTNRTSDFLQADEDWWQSTFANGSGTVYLGVVEYDDSAEAYAMDIGVPILDPETKQTIGVLRGTLDISAMIAALQDVDVGSTGNIVLIDSRGIVLYSHNPEDFMQPVPDSILALFQGGQSNWTQAKDMTGKPAILAYSSLAEDSDISLGWRILITQTKTEANQDIIRSLFISALAAILVVAFGIVMSRIVITRSIASPLGLLTDHAQELSLGNIIQHDNAFEESVKKRKDEIGQISLAFGRLTIYFQGAAAASSAIAEKDLTVLVTANSESDALGNAFAKMVKGLREVISQVSESVETVSASASQLASAADESRKATNQIATTMQQVALGTFQQTTDVSKTSGSVEQITNRIQIVSRGAQEQTGAINRASQVTANINAAIEQAAINAQSSVQGAIQAAESARMGSQTVEATIAGMQMIKTKVGLSMQKVREMGQRSEQIDTVVETIDDIAAQTNLLALNAAIEAARVQAKGEKTVEGLLQKHMLGAVNLLADILASGREPDSKELTTLAQLAQVEDFCISDADGVITSTNKPGSMGFRFSDDPRQESSVFRVLLSQRDGVVIRPIVVRDQDKKPYIYVGVSRRDRPGIVQAGSPADMVYSLGGYSRGFAVVASEVGKLAEHAKTSTREVTLLVRDLQKTVNEAVLVMEDGTQAVEKGSAQAAEASEALSSILKTADTVSRRVGEIAAAIQQVSLASTELVGAMETVRSIVEKNTTATEEMAVKSSELTQSVENIASVSEENSAAVEQVSASTEEMLAQVEQVSSSSAAMMEMAKSLQKIVAQFSLAH